MRFLFALLIPVMCAAQTLTTISQYVADAHGQPFSGFIQIQVQPFFSTNVAIRSHDIWLCSDPNMVSNCLKQIVGGIVTIQLAPNTGAVPPGTSYKVTYYPTPAPGTKAANSTEYWVVPTGGPFTIARVVVPVAPQPGVLINPIQLDPSGYASGQYPCITGGVFLPCGPTAGATWGQIGGTLSNQGDLQTALNGKQPTIPGAPGSWPAFAPIATTGSAGDLSSGTVSLLRLPTIPPTKVKLSSAAGQHDVFAFLAITDGSGDTAISGVCAVWGSDTSSNTGVIVAGDDNVANCLMGTSGSYPVFGFLGPAGSGQVLANVVTLQGGSRPACNSGQRGSVWQTFGGSGVADTVAVCAKDNSNAYAWRTIF